LRILFLLTQDIESPAGAGRYFPLAKTLAKTGHKVYIIGLHPNFPTLQQRRFTKEGVEIQYVAPMHVRKTVNNKVYYPTWKLLPLTIISTVALVCAALRKPVDLIHIGKPQPMNVLAGLIVSRIRRVPLLVDCDDYEARNNLFKSSWQQKCVEIFENLATLSANHITVHTHFLRDLLINKGVHPDRITYLPHGIDHIRFADVDPTVVEALRVELGLSNKKVVAFIGSLSRVTHALDDLLKAFVIVRKSRSDAVLLVVGRGEDFEWMQTQVNTLGLNEWVRLYGWVPPDKVPYFYRLADVSVDPVYDNEAGRASLSLKILESMAAGVPLVTVNVGDRHLVLGKPPAGILVPPGNPYALASAILLVLNNPIYAAKLREIELIRARQFYWERIIVRIEKIYKELAKGVDG